MVKRVGFGRVAILFVLTLVLMAAMQGQANAIVIDPCIPVGGEIRSATLSFYIAVPGDATVTVHRATAAWDENTVTWNSFGGSYDAALEGSFVADFVGWRSVDVTSLVQAWVNGTYPNYGFYLRQDINHTEYRASEYGVVEVRPMLEICYAVDGGTSCVTIQRSGAVQGGVADAYITELEPDSNRGSRDTLHTGLLNGYKKNSLISFELCQECVAALTPGFWKTHPEAWPVDSLTLGCETYSMQELMMILWAPIKGDISKVLAHHLIAAKLNLLSGTDAAPIADTVTTADSLLCTFPGKLPYGVRARSSIGQALLDSAYTLDLYNNNFLTPECAD